MDQMRVQLHEEPSLACFLSVEPRPPAFFRRTARTASSSTSFKPSRVSAEHSRYLHLSSSSKTFRAVSLMMGAFLGSLQDLVYCYRRSILLPTNIFTADGTTCSISVYHCGINQKSTFFAFLKEEGSITENAIINTSVPGYASGLNLENSSCPAVSLP